MDGRISTCQQPVGDQAGFRVTPEAAGYGGIILDLLADQTVRVQQPGDGRHAKLPQAQNRDWLCDRLYSHEQLVCRVPMHGILVCFARDCNRLRRR
jgi:hypothetical protein